MLKRTSLRRYSSVLSFVRVVAMASLICGAMASAGVPRTLHYQGRLADAAGAPLEGLVDLTFSLYSDAEGGASLWNETTSVFVANGLFSVELGLGTPLDLPFDQPYFLGVAVGSDPELAPRQALASVPYALGVAEGAIGKESLGRTCEDGEALIQGPEGWVCSNLTGPQGPPGVPAVAPPSTEVIGYASLGDLDCGETRTGYEEALPFYVLEQEVEQICDVGPTRGDCSTVDHRDIRLEADLTACASALFGLTATAQTLPEVLISFPVPGDDKAPPFLTLRLEDVIVSSAAFGESTNAGRRMGITLFATRMTWEYRAQATEPGGAKATFGYQIDRELAEYGDFTWSKTITFHVADVAPGDLPANNFPARDVSFGLVVAITPGALGGFDRSKPNLSVVTFTRTVDAETVPLLAALHKGTRLDFVTIETFAPDAGDPGAASLQVVLEQSRVLSMTLSAGRGEGLTERTTFDASKISWTTRVEGGSPDTVVYDQQMGSGS